jgi:hypothetical protein
MITQIVLTAKESTKDNLTKITVKRKNNLIATIFPPNKYHPNHFNVIYCNMLFQSTTKLDALELVRSKQETGANALGECMNWKYSATIKEI